MSKERVGGYNGLILRVNLSSKSTSIEELDQLFCRRYIGGAGFGIYYLWKELKAGIDALGPDNKLIFALGPVTGLTLPGAARHCVCAKSPLTGGIAKSEAGGFWGAELKRAGYDAIIIEGRSDNPAYLWIHDKEVEIRDAGHLWGKEIKETEAVVKAELGDERIQLASIGPGGENKVLYACIMHGLFDSAGRGGLGAVMGSKNLKAVAVRGHNLPEIVNQERIKEIRQQVSSQPHPMSQFGTGANMIAFEANGNLPVRNFRDGLFPEINLISGGTIKETIRIGMEGCFACPVRCKKVVKVEEPYQVDPAYGGPEYETLAALGSNCGISDLKAIAKASERCNAYSLDTISTGVTIGFAMECYEKGLLTNEDTGGLELKFGNASAMLQSIELIARRQGIGNLLAEGTARIAQKVGQGSKQFAMQVKGLECALHEPRYKNAFGLGFMVNPIGADHGVNLHDEAITNPLALKPLHSLGILEPLPMEDLGPRKVGLLKLMQSKAVVGDSAALCSFLPYGWEQTSDILKAVTGWDTGVEELLRVGERILTLSRLFNIREGLSAADDVLPERFFQPKTNGALSAKHLDRARYEKAKNFYYTLMGWDSSGVPLPEKVEELYIE